MRNDIIEDFDWYCFEAEKNRYHIGFFVGNLVYTHLTSIALYYDTEDCCFKYCYYSGYPECNLYDKYNLVLIYGVSDSQADSIVPLKEKPILSSFSDLSNEGLQIVYEDGHVSLYNGHSRLLLSHEDNELLLIHVRRTFKKEDANIRNQGYFGLHNDHFIKEMEIIEDRVKQFNLPEILQDLHISVREVFRSRVGRDDYYFVYKTVSIGYPKEKLDQYLIDYIGLGERCIYEDWGYTSAYNMAIKDLITGEYDEDNIKKERELLIANYSAQKHIFHNISEYVKQHIYPEGLRYPSRLLNEISLERNSLLPVFWKILRAQKYSEYFDELDRQCSHTGFTTETLTNINQDLQSFSESVTPLIQTTCFERDPDFPIL